MKQRHLNIALRCVTTSSFLFEESLYVLLMSGVIERSVVVPIHILLCCWQVMQLCFVYNARDTACGQSRMGSVTNQCVKVCTLNPLNRIHIQHMHVHTHTHTHARVRAHPHTHTHTHTLTGTAKCQVPGSISWLHRSDSLHGM